MKKKSCSFKRLTNILVHCLHSTQMHGAATVIINNNNHTGQTNLALQNFSLIGHQDDPESNLKLIDLQIVGFNKRLSDPHLFSVRTEIRRAT